MLHDLFMTSYIEERFVRKLKEKVDEVVDNMEIMKTLESVVKGIIRARLGKINFEELIKQVIRERLKQFL